MRRTLRPQHWRGWSNAFLAAMAVLGASISWGAITDPSFSQSPSATQPNSGILDGLEDDRLDEIVVSATKLPQPPRSQPISASVVSGEQLDAVGAQSFQDYLTRVPGVIFNATAPGLSTAVIRGIATTTSLDQGQGTTGYYLNDIPLTDPSFAVAIPDIDTFDVDRIATLRGPQGTLFGSASLGGAINYQTTPPDLTGFHARFQGTAASTSNGAPSKGGKIMVNAPLIGDQLAVRAVYSYRDDGGYIDNLGTGAKDSNGTEVHSLRGEVLWKPSQATRVSYLFLQQTEDTADNGYTEPNIAGPLQKNTLIPEPLAFETRLHSLRIDQDFGFAALTATGSYHQKQQFSNSDVTAPLASLFAGELSPIYGPQRGDANGSTVEVRLTSPSDLRVTYVVGVMRDATHQLINDQFGASGAQRYATSVFDPLFGPGFGAAAVPNDIFFQGTSRASGDERGIFGESTLHLSPTWALTLGGRYFDTVIRGSSSAGGLLEYLSTDPSILSFNYSSTERARGFTPKAALTWNATPDFMAYALASKGFRFGGPNINPPDSANPFPPTYAPDSLWNYELGVRTDWFDRKFEWDATAFYVDWNNIQVRLETASGLTYATNFGRAVNYGLENAWRWSPTAALTLGGSLSYLNATLRQDIHFGETDAPQGSVLPGASRWNFSSSLQYQLNGMPLRPRLLLSDRYLSRAPGDFGQAAPVSVFGYNLLDTRLAFTFKRLETTLFMSNIANRRGVSAASDYSGSPLEQYVVRPRTVGITLDYRF